MPVCSHCKSVRNDEGYWETLDVFITENTESVISHGICPKCVTTHYGEIAGEG